MKKLRRVEDGLANENDPGRRIGSVEAAHAAIAEELADTVLYAVLLAARINIDLGQAVVEKFNKTSERYGFPERLPQSTTKRFDFADWSADKIETDQETGAPGIASFANAVQMWSTNQLLRPTTVREAAAVFNVAPERIIQAVEYHYWMFLSGDPENPLDQTIEHDGE